MQEGEHGAALLVAGGDLAGVNQESLAGQESDRQITNRHAAPGTEVVQLAPDSLAPSPSGAGKPAKIGIRPSGLAAGCSCGILRRDEWRFTSLGVTLGV